MKIRLYIISILFLVLASHSVAQPVCPQTLIGTEKATASVMANVLGRNGSIKNVSRQLVEQAIKVSDEQSAAYLKCKISCPEPKREIVFKSLPTSYLDTEASKKECGDKITSFEKGAFKASNRAFRDIDALMDWISEFSQGKGREGEALYKQCDGSCSPGYKFFINKKDKGFEARALAKCGLPRNKSENTYSLTASIDWSCAEE